MDIKRLLKRLKLQYIKAAGVSKLSKLYGRVNEERRAAETDKNKKN